MSPNEFQLRAALRDGEGEHLNPDTVIARARAMTQARHDRRIRLASVAAVVAVVGGIGVAGGIALNGGGNDKTASSVDANRSASGSSGAADGAPNAANEPVAPGPMADALAVACPDTAPALQTPGSAATGQFGAADSLFSGPVESIKICGYQQQSREPVTAADGQPMNTVLTGQQATALAASLDAAPKIRPKTPCPLYLSANGKTIVIIGLSTSGQAMKPITATVAQNPCNQPVTNGTAIRYNWAAPGSLTGFIAKLQPNGGGPIRVIPSGKVTGSPVRS